MTATENLDTRTRQSKALRMLDAALAWAAKGVAIFPCSNETKRPIIAKSAGGNGFHDATTDAQQIRAWWDEYPHALIGAPTGEKNGFWVIDTDIDAAKGIDGEATLQALLDELGIQLPETPTVRTPRGGRHLRFRWDPTRPVGCSTSEVAHGIDTRGEGGYVILPPGRVRGIGNYEWLSSGEFADCPPPLLARMPVPPSERAKQRESDGSFGTGTDHQRTPQQKRAYGRKALQGMCDELAATPEGQRNDKLFDFAFRAFCFCNDGYLDPKEVADALGGAAEASGLDAEEINSALRSAYTTAEGKHAHVPPPPPPPGAGPGGPAAAADPDASAPAFSDEALALEYARRHAERLRYVDLWGKWFHSNGKLWRADDIRLAHNYARAVCRDAAAQLDEADEKAFRLAKSLTRGMVSNTVERLARSDPRLATTPDAFDRDQHLLNTPLGVVDLRIGRSLFHDPARMMSKTTSVAPGGDCRRWDAFLLRMFDGDRELIAFLQRFFGYALTGWVKEQVFAFFYGTGGNGKGTLLNTIGDIFGSYFRKAPIELLMDSKFDRHPTELANLCGARLVTTSEIEKGRNWKLSRLKDLTGGDPITANFMRQDPFTYMPQFTLVISGNEKPGFGSVDEAIRRRMLLIPCMVTIPPADRDPDLPAKLKLEAGGILQWMVKGAVLYNHKGLQVPASVRAASDEYLASEDTTQRFIDDCCESTSERTERGKLYWAWQEWAADNGEDRLSTGAFSKELNKKGFPPERSHNVPYICGLKLNRVWELRYRADAEQAQRRGDDW